MVQNLLQQASINNEMINWKPILVTLGGYITGVAAAVITDKLYVPRGANDITGPPFLVAVFVALLFIVFFFVTVYKAAMRDRSYWAAALLQMILILFTMYMFMT